MSEPEGIEGEIVSWADPAMYQSEKMAVAAPRVYLLSATPDPLGAIAAMCMMYEGKVIRDLSRVTDDQRRFYWEQANATHLKAPLEAVDLHFMIEGVSRAFTHQMVRQRTAVYAQESLRFAVKESPLEEEIPLPPSIRPKSPEHATWYTAIKNIHQAYLYLIANGVPAEDARGLLPHATLTRLHYKTNLRNLLDHLGNRLCTQAQFEWRFVGAQIREALYNWRGEVTAAQVTIDDKVIRTERFNDWQWKLMAESGPFRPVCYALGHCPFTASFDRPCTIRDRVQAGQFDQIRDAEWLLDPRAARS